MLCTPHCRLAFIAPLVAAVSVFVALPATSRAQCNGFSLSQSSGASITPGTTDIGNHCDDCVTPIGLPFSVSLYGTDYTTAQAGSNGTLQFTTNSNAFGNACLPQGVLGVAICPYWDDLRTDGAGEGIFTSTTGAVGSRVFHIEWRAHYYSGTGSLNFEVRLFEGSNNFEIVYGAVGDGGAGATIGVQHTTFLPMQYSCNVASLSAGQKLTFNCTTNTVPPSGTGSSAPGSVSNCGSATSLLTVAVTPGSNPASTGLAVRADLSTIGGSSTQAFRDDGMVGDAIAGDNVFSYSAPIGSGVIAGAKTLPFMVSDAQGRSGTGSITLAVTTCVGAPVNDACANAISITPGTYNGTTVGATNDGPGSCGASATSPDVWYSFTPASSAAVQISTCGSSWDTVLSALTGSCGSLTEVACNDDSCGLQSQISFNATAGTTYRIRVAGYNGTTGAFTLNLSLATPQPNDACANAIAISVGSTTGTTFGATNDGATGCGSSNTSPDVWYTTVGAQARLLTVTTCNGGASFDTVLSIHSGCPGTAANTLACSDNYCTTLSRVQVQAEIGQTYYIRVSGNNNASGTFTIAVSYQDPPPPPSRGPDVFVGRLTDVANYGAVGGITAFAVGTDACNMGDLPVSWYNGTPNHPLIGGNMFRYAQVNGAARFEQLGQSWLKYAFSSTNSGTCGTCVQPPDGGQQLGVSCSDAYGSGLNGSQGGLGPRSAVNATAAIFPATHPPGDQSSLIGNRLQVYSTDIDPAQNPGARYFVDAHYVTADDAQWNNGVDPAVNGLNNASYQEITNVTSPSPTLVGGATTAACHQRAAGIQAWQDIDPTVTIANADYVDSSLGAPGIVARFIVGAKATSLGFGQYRYEYAVYNLNADRNAGSFSIPLPNGAVVSNVGFHGVFTHSGEPYANTATNPSNWTGVASIGQVTWTSPQTFAQNPNTNALRWGTMYNFRFDTNVPPSTGSATLGLFRPGTPTALTATVPVPRPCHGTCVADFDDGSGTGTPDGGVTIDDLLYYLGIFEQGTLCADVDDGTSTGTPDGGVTIDDLLYYLLRFEAGC